MNHDRKPCNPEGRVANLHHSYLALCDGPPQSLGHFILGPFEMAIDNFCLHAPKAPLEADLFLPASYPVTYTHIAAAAHHGTVS